MMSNVSLQVQLVRQLAEDDAPAMTVLSWRSIRVKSGHHVSG